MLYQTAMQNIKGLSYSIASYFICWSYLLCVKSSFTFVVYQPKEEEEEEI